MEGGGDSGKDDTSEQDMEDDEEEEECKIEIDILSQNYIIFVFHFV